MQKTRITIVKLPRKDRPYHHAVCGPGAELLKFTTRRKAELYASLRKQCKTQGLAKGEFEQRFPLGTSKLECAPVTDDAPKKAPEPPETFTERSIREIWGHLKMQGEEIERMRRALNATTERVSECVKHITRLNDAHVPEPVKTPGQIAYAAYAHTFGHAMPTWESKTQESRDAWEAAAEAVSTVAIKSVAPAIDEVSITRKPREGGGE